MGVIMRCLALYGLEPDWGFGSLYTAFRKHLGTAFQDVQNCKVTFDDWPRAKKISGGALLEIISGHSGIRTVEGNLVFSVGKKSDLGYFLISSIPEMLFIGLPDNVERIIRIEVLVKNIAHELRLGYGYVFNSNKDDGPALYASGITYVRSDGTIDQVTSLDNDRWFNELVLEKGGRKRYRDEGMMRGVYEVNVLNVSHIRRMICDKSLSDLIIESDWGSLEKVTNYNWLWRIVGNSRSDAEAYLRSCSVFV